MLCNFIVLVCVVLIFSFEPRDFATLLQRIAAESSLTKKGLDLALNLISYLSDHMHQLNDTLYEGLRGTLKRVVWHFEEGGVVL